MTYRVVVPISGGKDSQTCLKLALEQHYPAEVLGLFLDTQFEHPVTYEHIDWMQKHYGVEVRRISAGSVPDQVLRWKRFPGGGARHCTEYLKLKPAKDFYRDLAEKQGGYEVWLGMRMGESHARRKRYAEQVDTDLYPPHEVFTKFPKYLSKLGVWFRMPVLGWSTAEVLDFVGEEANSLYSYGFDRVGCFPCLAAGDRYKEQCFEHDATGRQQRERVRELERAIGVSVWKSKSGKQRHASDYEDGGPGCAVCSI